MIAVRIWMLVLLPFTLACQVGSSEAQAEVTPASEGSFAVQGTLRFTGRGPLYLFIADEKTFATPMAGIEEVVLHPEGRELEDEAIGYRFEGIPAGTYAIRCFQDENGNGKLDRGMTGPKEPWGMSFRPGKSKHLRPPKFDEVSFEVRQDISGLDIVVD